MTHPGRIVLAAALAAFIPLAAAQAGGEVKEKPKAPAAAAKPPAGGDRYVILEIYQAQRDLDHGDPRINVLFDSKDGRSWVMRYEPMPGSNEVGYVWVEVPFKTAPKPTARRR